MSISILAPAPLRPRFDALWARAIGLGDPSCAFARLDAGYSEPGRAYHGWAHVAAMLDSLDAVAADPACADIRLDEVELAVFFHDAASAELFVMQAGAGLALGAEGVERVRSMIFATAEHRSTADAATRLLLDLDLAILGAEPETYAAYARAIRREYTHVPE